MFLPEGTRVQPGCFSDHVASFSICNARVQHTGPLAVELQQNDNPYHRCEAHAISDIGAIDILVHIGAISGKTINHYIYRPRIKTGSPRWKMLTYNHSIGLQSNVQQSFFRTTEVVDLPPLKGMKSWTIGRIFVARPLCTCHHSA